MLGSTAILVALLGACSSEARPPPAQEAVSTNDERSSLVAPDSCEPASYRPCHYYYVDADGRLHCPIRTQYCDQGGRWLPCGQPPDQTTEP